MLIPSPVIGRVRQSQTDATRSVSVNGIDPTAFGASVGSALQNTAGVVNQIGERLMTRDDQFEVFNAQKNFTEFELENARAQVEIHRTAAPDGSDVERRMEAALEANRKKFLSTINPGLVPDMDVRVANSKQKFIAGSSDFKVKAQDATVRQTVFDRLNVAKVGIDSDPDTAESHLEQLKTLINSSPLSTQEKVLQLRMVEVELRKLEASKRIALGELDKFNANPAAAVDVVAEKIVGAEKGATPDARNPNSSAMGDGQFIETTWLEVVRAARPDLARGKTEEEILALRSDPVLSREMVRVYMTQNAEKLRNSGIPPTPANLYLSHFLGPSGAVKVLTASPETAVQNVVHPDALIVNKSVFDKAPTAGALISWAKEKMGTGAVLKSEKEATQNAQGYWVLPGVTYDLAGKVRQKPVTKEYIEKVVPAVRAVDPDLEIKITSAGQESEKSGAHPFLGKRVGSHRHDVNEKGESETSDFVLVKNGKVLLPGDNKELYVKVLENLASQGFTGIGHYKWGIHVGGGTRAVWGPSTTATDVDPDFKRAVERGWAKSGDKKVDVLDTDRKYVNIPYEDRVLLRQQAAKESSNFIAQRAQEMQAEGAQRFNTLMNTIMSNPTQGQALFNTMLENNQLPDFRQRKQAMDLLERFNGEAQLVAQGLARLSQASPVFDPNSQKDKDTLNALVRQNKGIERLTAADRDYFTNTVVPVVQKSSDIPTDIVGPLEGMIRTNDLAKAIYAIDALSQLKRIDQRAYDARVPERLRRDVDFFNSRRGTLPDAELMREINGGSTPEEIQAKTILRKEAENIFTNGTAAIKDVSGTVMREVLTKNNSFFQFGPRNVSSLGWAASVMEKEVRDIFVDEYLRYKDVKKASEKTAEIMNEKWAVTEVGDRKIFMKYPPERAGYKPYGGDFSWITESARKELTERYGLKPGEKFELLSDYQTEQEVKTGKSASYRFVIFDKNNVPRALEKPVAGGMLAPVRLSFAPDPAFLLRLEARDEHDNTVAVLRQELRERYSMYDASDDSSVSRQVKAEIDDLEARIASMDKRRPSIVDRSKELEFEQRMKLLGEQSTAPGFRRN